MPEASCKCVKVDRLSNQNCRICMPQHVQINLLGNPSSLSNSFKFLKNVGGKMSAMTILLLSDTNSLSFVKPVIGCFSLT